MGLGGWDWWSAGRCHRGLLVLVTKGREKQGRGRSRGDCKLRSLGEASGTRDRKGVQLVRKREWGEAWRV